MAESIPKFENFSLVRYGNVFVITLQNPPENKLNVTFCQELIIAYRTVQRIFGHNSPGAVITRGSDAKFWCTGIDLEEFDRNPYANEDGFFPLIHTILDFPYPTVALITGHTFGGASLFALAHDYRVMNSARGFISMPPVMLGLHFNGIGALPRLKLAPRVVRKMLLEATKWTGPQALEDGVVDAIATPDDMFNVALDLAHKWAPAAKAGVYGLLRDEIYGEALRRFQNNSYVHGRYVAPKQKL